MEKGQSIGGRTNSKNMSPIISKTRGDYEFKLKRQQRMEKEREESVVETR